MILFMRPRLYNALPSQYERLLRRNLNLSEQEAKRVMKVYPLSKYGNKPRDAFGYILTDLSLACPSYLGLDSVAEKGLPTYYYRFDYNRMKGGKSLGAFHSSEIPFVFNSLDQKPFTVFYDEKNIGPAKELSRIIQSYWVNFAKTGDPNGPGLPEWPGYEPESKMVQVLDLTVKSEQTDMNERCVVWDGYAKTRQPIFENLARKEKGRGKK